MKPFSEGVKEFLSFVDGHELYPATYLIKGKSTGPEIEIDGHKKIIFCSSNYLGLAGDTRVISTYIEAAKVYGHGSCGSRLISGTTDAHKALEEALASYKKAEEALVFSAGMLVNIGIIPAVFNIPDVRVNAVVKRKLFGGLFAKPNSVFSDSLNHASIIDGVKLSGAKKYIYQHNNTHELESYLRKDRAEIKLIISDGVFSMDGDEAKITELVSLKKRYGALLMLDDAHASGVLGKNGRGTHEKQGVNIGDIDIYMGTLSKAFGGVGGFAVMSKELARYFRVSARTYIFNGSIPAASALAIKKAIEISEEEHWRRDRVQFLATEFRNKMHSFGFNTLSSTTHIVPVLIGKEELALDVARKLQERGIFAPAVRWPATEKGRARIRVAFMATHTDEHLGRLIDAFREIDKEVGINR